jgi:hypothetical protein
MYSDTQVFKEVHNYDFQNFPAIEMSIQDMDSSLEFHGNIIVNENMETISEDHLESKSDSSSNATLRSLWYNASSVSQAYGKILNDIKVTFLPSLVPEIHLQVSSMGESYKMLDRHLLRFLTFLGISRSCHMKIVQFTKQLINQFHRSQ